VVLLARITAAVGVTCVLATLGGRLAQRVGQPPVAGEVVAGLILGPSVVATLLPGLYHYLLPAQVMAFVSIGAQAGLAIFMFTVGAEFDPGILRGQRGVIGSASLAMMALPFALGVVTASRCSRPSTGRQGRPCRSPCSSGRP
jgi:Kef-type K+ transport system membrane component KefB